MQYYSDRQIQNQRLDKQEWINGMTKTKRGHCFIILMKNTMNKTVNHDRFNSCNLRKKRKTISDLKISVLRHLGFISVQIFNCNCNDMIIQRIALPLHIVAKNSSGQMCGVSPQAKNLNMCIYSRGSPKVTTSYGEADLDQQAQHSVPLKIPET